MDGSDYTYRDSLFQCVILVDKIRRTVRAHWNKIIHLWNYDYNEHRLVHIWMRQLFASVGQVAQPSHRYILTGPSLVMVRHLWVIFN